MATLQMKTRPATRLDFSRAPRLIGPLALLLSLQVPGASVAEVRQPHRCLTLQSDKISAAPGVVIEAVPAGSALEEAGLLPGDTVYAWESVEAAPGGLGGCLLSVFDWALLEVELAPQAEVTLSIRRGNLDLALHAKPSDWRAQVAVSPPFPARCILISPTEQGDSTRGKYSSEKVSAQSAWAQYLYAEGRKLLDHENWGEAESAFRTSLLLRPPPVARALILLELGRVLISKDLPREALTLLVEAHDSIIFEPHTALLSFELEREIARSQWRDGAFSEPTERLRALLNRVDALAPQSTLAPRIRQNLASFLVAKGHRLEAETLALRGLELCRTLRFAEAIEADLLLVLGNVALSRGDLAAAESRFQESLSKATGRGGTVRIARILSSLSTVAFEQGDLRRAKSLLLEAIELQGRLSQQSVDLAESLSDLARIEIEEWNLDQAEQDGQRSVAILRKSIGDPLRLSLALTRLGIVHYRRGDLEAAEVCLEEALALRRAWSPVSLEVAESLENLSLVASHRLDHGRAFSLLNEVMEIQKKLDIPASEIAGTLANIGLVLSRSGRNEEGEEYLKKAVELYRAAGSPRSLSDGATFNLAGIYLESDRLSLASALLEHLLSPNRGSSEEWIIPFAEFGMGDLQFSRGRISDAALHFARSAELFESAAPASIELAQALYGLGQCLDLKGSLGKAQDSYQRALLVLDSYVANSGGGVLDRFRLIGSYRNAYRSLISLLFRLGETWRALEVSEQYHGKIFGALLRERSHGAFSPGSTLIPASNP